MMNRLLVILQIVLFFISIVCILAAALFFPAIMICFGPITLGIFMLALILSSIAVITRSNRFYRGAILALLICAIILIAYLIMCMIIDVEVNILDFLLYRI